MKRGFTLVELLVVVVVIVTLMGIMFRIGNAGGDTNCRNTTVNRMQRLENCLSGYYAAYGSYPPVKLHGSRDFHVRVDGHGIQQVGTKGPSGSTGKGGLSSRALTQGGKAKQETELIWESVDAACKSQPIGMSYPFKNPQIQDYIKTVSKKLMDYASSNDSKYKEYRNNPALQYGFQPIVNNSMLSGKEDKEDWTEVQIFKFGVLSYILPRYMIMMGGQTTMNQIYEDHKSWTANNELPARFEDGVPYSSWGDFNNDVRQYPWKVAVLTSQAVCARWLPNLENTIQTQYNMTIFGVQVRDEKDSYANVSTANPHPQLYSAGNSQSGGSNYSQQYVLDGMTVVDGWKHEFYYYSPPPHQSYRLWSAGSNGRTFPPWVSDEELKTLKDADQKTVQNWIGDDIVQMSK